MILQTLYALEVGKDFRMEAAEEFWKRRGLKKTGSREFITKTVAGVLDHRKEIDRSIEKNSRNWSLPRIAAVERSILRIAAFEILHVPETPVQVAINEAVELAKIYGGKDSSGFVNGILDQLARSARSEIGEGKTGKSPG
jgi:N utilization substance protein B